MLDADVDRTLPRQWMSQQPHARHNGRDVLATASDALMDWEGRLPSGPHGVRLFVTTLFCWGAQLDSNNLSERLEWNGLARDIADVLTLLAAQAGPYTAPEISQDAEQGTGKRVK